MVPEETRRRGIESRLPSEGMGLKTKIDRIYEALEIDRKKPGKPIKPLKKLSHGQLKKNYCLVFLLKRNLSLDIQKVPIVDDMIYIKENDTYHLATADYIWRYGKFPAILLPEWSLEPINPYMLARKSQEEGAMAVHQKVVIMAAKLSQLKQKKGFPKALLWIILGIVAIIVVIALLNKKI